MYYTRARRLLREGMGDPLMLALVSAVLDGDAVAMLALSDHMKERGYVSQ